MRKHHPAVQHFIRKEKAGSERGSDPLLVRSAAGWTSPLTAQKYSQICGPPTAPGRGMGLGGKREEAVDNLHLISASPVPSANTRSIRSVGASDVLQVSRLPLVRICVWWWMKVVAALATFAVRVPPVIVPQPHLRGDFQYPFFFFLRLRRPCTSCRKYGGIPGRTPLSCAGKAGWCLNCIVAQFISGYHSTSFCAAFSYRSRAVDSAVAQRRSQPSCFPSWLHRCALPYPPSLLP
jgi:hypothetical protein